MTYQRIFLSNAQVSQAASTRGKSHSSQLPRHHKFGASRGFTCFKKLMPNVPATCTQAISERLEQAAIDSQKAKPRTTTAPPVPLRRPRLQPSVKAGAMPLQLLAVQPTRAESSNELRTNLPSTVFTVAVTLGKPSLQHSAALDCFAPPQAVRESRLT